MVQDLASGRCFPLVYGTVQSVGRDNDYLDASNQQISGILDLMLAGVTWKDSVKQVLGANTWVSKMVCSEKRHRFFTDYLKLCDEHILDLGTGWGQLSVPLSKSNRVVGVDGNRRKLEFVEARCRIEKCLSNFCGISGDFMNLRFEESFDTVIMNGVLEWVPRFSSRIDKEADPQMEAITLAYSFLEKGGKLILGIENRLGVKYLLGARDDHIGCPHVLTLEWADARDKYLKQTSLDLDVRVRSLDEYLEMIEAAEFSKVEVNCAFPDYKLPEIIIPSTDCENLSTFAESRSFPVECDGYDGSKLEMEKDVHSLYYRLGRLGIIKYFSPSYYFVCYK